MKLTHNLRNISRTLEKINFEIIGKAVLTSMVITSLLVVLTNNQRAVNTAEPSGSQVMGQKNTLDVNSHLQKALNHTLSFTKTKDTSEIEKAIGALQTSLQLDPNNAYALRLLETLTKENQPNIEQQVEKTVEILQRRADYSAAWLRLAILYQQLGEDNLANEALRRAKSSNSNW